MKPNVAQHETSFQLMEKLEAEGCCQISRAKVQSFQREEAPVQLGAPLPARLARSDPGGRGEKNLRGFC